jgi:hypothetical protein
MTPIGRAHPGTEEGERDVGHAASVAPRVGRSRQRTARTEPQLLDVLHARAVTARGLRRHPGGRRLVDRAGQEACRRAGCRFNYLHPPQYYGRQRLVELQPGRRVLWHLTDSHLSFIPEPAEWTGTEIVFDVLLAPGGTELRFKPPVAQAAKHSRVSRYTTALPAGLPADSTRFPPTR